MTVLKDSIYQDTKVKLELTLYPSESGDPDWVVIHLLFKFDNNYPEISIKRECQEILDTKRLISEVRNLVAGKIASLEFEPIEPNYILQIKKSSKTEFDLWCTIDAAGASGGVYSGTGPSIHMSVTRKSLKKFADTLEKELKEIKGKVV